MSNNNQHEKDTFFVQRSNTYTDQILDESWNFVRVEVLSVPNSRHWIRKNVHSSHLTIGFQLVRYGAYDIFQPLIFFLNYKINLTLTFSGASEEKKEIVFLRQSAQLWLSSWLQFFVLNFDSKLIGPMKSLDFLNMNFIFKIKKINLGHFIYFKNIVKNICLIMFAT